MKPLILDLFNSQQITSTLKKIIKTEAVDIILKKFPDGETYLRINSVVKNHDVIIVANLNQPDEKILSLIFIAETLREQGAKKIGLIAPYLPYMRQDKIFTKGEGLTSRYFAKLISHYFDWLITVEPHLHRYPALNVIYPIPAVAVSAADAISIWIRNNIDRPFLIGPDSESGSWIKNIADNINAPYVISEKIRMSDRSVAVKIPKLEIYRTLSPVIVDDIISTGTTVLETVKQLRILKIKPAVCIGVHALFTTNGYKNLLKNNVDRVITCNTIAHSSNEIDITQAIIDAFEENFGINNKIYAAKHGQYPDQLMSTFQLIDGSSITIRPIRAEDAKGEQIFIKKLSAESRYFRFMENLNELTPKMLKHFTQIDYDREMALVAVWQNEIVGIARYSTEPDGRSCEFAIVIADAWQHKGIGSHLMHKLIIIAKARGLHSMRGEILARNTNMLTLVRHLGFKIQNTEVATTKLAIKKL